MTHTPDSIAAQHAGGVIVTILGLWWAGVSLGLAWLLIRRRTTTPVFSSVLLAVTTLSAVALLAFGIDGVKA